MHAKRKKTSRTHFRKRWVSGAHARTVTEARAGGAAASRIGQLSRASRRIPWLAIAGRLPLE